MALNTYLGPKGYTILKNEIPLDMHLFIKKELCIKPFIQGAPQNLTNTFLSYRESNNKFYVPRYFGEKHFGKPLQIKIKEGDNINLKFQGELRENQVVVVETYLDYVKDGGGGLLDLPCAFGKTSLSLYILSMLKKKTLVIVHKEFLLNQWIERIHQFLPNARVGKIQGQIIDIDNKDIVLGMLQSLSMKEYPSNIFDSFGLTIIDEVHHISSEVFSCALFKIVTPYMLGLSATMNRKDGTTNVFKMFIGDIVYKEMRKQDNDVIVKCMKYECNDPTFNEVEYDYRGKVKFSTMISKLCAFVPRSEFILQIIKDMLLENPQQQIMILAHNKNILKYLHDAICERNISDVGYYIGGMKEPALKMSETKTIIIATYAMAAEALDIKTLTTLIMATPKTDIEQAVGRILRSKHLTPVVVDIVDKHELFKRQWIKRQQFYKKQNYKIIQYADAKWSTIYEPTCL